MSPSAPSRREITRQRKVENICMHALQLIEEEGLDGLTIGHLAKRMDWAMGALYRYFPSKDALFLELQSRVVNDHAAAMTTGLNALPDERTSLEKAVYCALHYFYWFRARRGPSSLIAMSLAHPQQLISDHDGLPIFRSAFASLQRTSECLSNAQTDGALAVGVAAEQTIILWANLMGLLQVAKLGRFAPELIDVQRLVEVSITSLFVGWGARRGDVERAIRAHNRALKPSRQEPGGAQTNQDT